MPLLSWRSCPRAGHPRGHQVGWWPLARFHDRVRRPARQQDCRSSGASRQPQRSRVSLDNLAIARVFAEIGDLLEIKNENPFKIRAYRNASETIAHAAERMADLTAAERLAIPGIGKDL